MAKRSAENQITREGGGLDDDEIVEDGQGFKRASDETLASRPMKGLPKRRGVAPLPAGEALPSSGDSIKRPAFSGFAGFGAPPPATSAPPPALNADNKPSLFAGFSGFGTTAPTVNTTSSAFTPGPSFGATSTSASKPFQLFGSTQPSSTNSLPSKTDSPFPPSTLTQPQTAKATQPPTDSESTSKAANLEYYLSLRGLNHSVIAALEQAIVTDPFVDLPLEAIAKTYVRYRKEVEEKRDKVTKPAALPPKAEPPKPPAVSAFSLPAPPSGGFGFGGKPLALGSTSMETSSTSKPAPFSFGGATSSSSPFGMKPASSSAPTGGFVPLITKPDEKTKPSPFSLPSMDTPSLSFPFGSSNASDKTIAPPSISFGAGGLFSTQTSTSAPPANTSSSSGLPVPSIILGGPPKEAAKEAEKPTIAPFAGFSAFGPSSFGSKPIDSSSATSKSEVKEPTASIAPSPFSGLSASKPATPSFFSFGKSSSTPASTQATSNEPTAVEKRPSLTPGFGFGAGTPKPAFSFGSPSAAGPGSGSLGNPVGFSFGSPPKETPFAAAAASAASKPAASLPFMFGSGTPSASAVPSSVVSVDSRDTSPAQPADTGPEAVDDSEKDVVGEGEQNEDTLVNQRGKAYRFVNGAWVDKGIIYFKIKKDRDTGKHRILARNETSGRVVINFNLFAGFKVAAGDKNTLDFVGQDGGQSATFKVRFKTADQVQEVKSKVEEVVSGL